MINPQSLTEQLLFCTLRIEAGDSVGTGFFYSVKLQENKEIPLIITNKHVVRNNEIISFSLHEAKLENNKNLPAGRFIKINYKSKWINHPNNEIDLCATPLQPLINQIEKNGKKIYYIKLSEDLIWNDEKLEELRTVEDVLMVGYPIGLWDEYNNLPLFRKGITSIHPALNFKGKNLGVIDTAVFPGSSGSPILIVNEGGYNTKKGMIIGSSRTIFLGVLTSGPFYNSEGNFIEEEIPTNKQYKTYTKTMVNLGYYIKSKEIIKLGEEFKKIILHSTLPLS